MALPIVVQYSLTSGNATSIVNAQGTTAAGVALTQATTVLDNQRRLLFTTTGNESSNSFTVRGLNQAGFPIVEVITGPNATTTRSNLDFKIVSSIVPLVATVGTTSVGTDIGSSMWNIMNQHVSPVNIQIGCVIQGALGVNYTVQYCYDDPNNLPSGVTFPQPFNHPTLAAQTTSLDGSINDPVFAVRLQINSGTGTVRMTTIQAGIAGP